MTDTQEVWVDIENYEENYEVSSYGRVRNKKTNRVLKCSSNPDGYLKVGLSETGKETKFSVHRLVANAFCQNDNNYNMVDHINGSRTDNHYKNLRFCTSQQNSANRKKNHNSKSKYKGLRAHTSGKWQAQIMINGKRKHLGTFDDEKEAAQRYNAEAERLFGDFAKLNDISDSDSDTESDPESENE